MFVLYNSKADILDPLINNGGAKKARAPMLQSWTKDKKCFEEDVKFSSVDFSSVLAKCWP